MESRMKSKLNKRLIHLANGSTCQIFGFKARFGDILSNFYSIPVTLLVTPHSGKSKVVTFPSSEHAYQWASRVYPITHDLSNLQDFVRGGHYDGFPDEMRYNPNGPKTQTGKIKPESYVKTRGPKQIHAIGIAAKMSVGQKGRFGQYPRPHEQGLSAAQGFKIFWKPILTAKFAQNAGMLHALDVSADRVLIEYGKSVMNPRQSKGKDTWLANVWNGKVDEDTCKGGAGFNVMGQHIMKVRRALAKLSLIRNPSNVKWPHALPV
jgi:hypothetical protein